MRHEGPQAVDARLRGFPRQSFARGSVSPEIRRILDARFSLAGLEACRESDPVWWNSTRNDMGRGIYGEAMRELKRLEAATASELDAELAAIAFR
jgi:hypothetical protein